MSGEAEQRVQCGAPTSVGADPAINALGHLGLERALRWCNRQASAEHTLPIALVAGITIASLLWNERVGLTFVPELPLATYMITIFVFFGIAVIFSTVWSHRVIVELATYFALWGTFPIFAIRLNYLAATLDFPLRDMLFARADSALGFDWRTWASLAWSHPALINILVFCYRSNVYQPLIVVLIVAIWGPRGRNREIITATAIASLLTVVVSALLPAFGPYRAYGIASGWDAVLAALRAGTHAPLQYVGIVTFPSFHASMAVILAASMRGYRYVFPVAVIVDSFMLLATVPIGYHYLVDVIAGCAIGFGALFAAHHFGKRSKVSSFDFATRVPAVAKTARLPVV